MFLARQDYPENSTSLYTAYLDATLKPHGYLLLDLTQDKDDRLRFRTNIFRTEETIIYSPMDDDERVKSNYLALHALSRRPIRNCVTPLYRTVTRE